MPSSAAARLAPTLAAFLLAMPVAAGACTALDLPVARLDPPPSQYTAFCARQAEACTPQGDAVIDWTPDMRDTLDRINRAVNAEIRLLSDWGNSGREELWSFPANGFGDCEDFMLEKRRRLVAAGVPGGALSCAIVTHKTALFPHAVLLAETTAGTWVLDNLSPDLTCWSLAPYRFVRREGPGGLWLRYEQD